MNALIRKFRALARDPVLRCWLLQFLTGRAGRPQPFVPHRPPYLTDADAGEADAPKCAWAGRVFDPPAGRLAIPLPGEVCELDPEGAGALFDRAFSDLESRLALHRFAWVPLMRGRSDPAWVAHLWHLWMDRFSQPTADWPWHPYTAAERAINILDFCEVHGVPEPRQRTLEVLARHAPAIAARLEYFGEHNTSNHLANNGRGLYNLGIRLGLHGYAELGGKILIEEAKRIFTPSGYLREGSSHYHLLLTRGYLQAWMLARAAGRPEAPDLAAIAEKSVAAAKTLCLPGGMPLIGDISPDCPPADLLGIVDPETLGDPPGWSDRLPNHDRERLREIVARARPLKTGQFADGWGRFARGGWEMLMHAAPDGWSQMPGHGHQDIGSFELHWRGQAVIVDPGRGAYGEEGPAGWYCSAMAHNGLLVDGHDPLPPNKPYYDAAFRRRIGGSPPIVSCGEGRVSLRHQGFSRLKGCGAADRTWDIGDHDIAIRDRVDGAGRHHVRRRFFSPYPVSLENGRLAIDLGNGTLIMEAPNTTVALQSATRWRAYGVGEPIAVIDLQSETELPWAGEVRFTVTTETPGTAGTMRRPGGEIS